MRVITICAFKGGSGKTTTAQTLAAGLVKRGYKVLALDTDRQTNLTTNSGINPGKCKATIYDLLKEGRNGKPLQVVNTTLSTSGKYDLIPGSIQLESTEYNFFNADTWKYSIQDIIQPVRDQYDFTVIDTNTNPGIMTRAALYAADSVIIPIEPSVNNFQGLAQAYKRITSIQQDGRQGLSIAGILLVKTNLSTTAHKMTYNQIQQFAAAVNVHVFNTTIRRASVIEEAQIMQESIFDYAEKSKPAQDYYNFIDEYLKGEGKQ